MRNYQDPFETRKQSFISVFSVCMTVPLMYEVHYSYIKRKFSADLLFTDTDSLVYEIKTDDVFEDFYGDKNLFDFSDYSVDSKFCDPVNKKVIGKMKYEFRG